VDPSIGIEVAGRTGLNRTGSTLCELPVPAVTSAWSRIWRPLRQTLPQDCYAAGEVLSRIEQSEDAVAAIFEDGSRAEGDLLVAADGLHSTARAQLLPDSAPRYAGYVAWRGTVDPARLAADLHGLMFHRMVFGFPGGELMLSIPMPTPQGELGRTCHFVWFRPAAESILADLCTDASGRRHGASIPPPLIRPELVASLKSDADTQLAPQLAALLDGTTQIILQPIFDFESPCIAFGRVALVGDAAFVARPHVATGVMKAAIDAESLADALGGESDVAAALERYNTVRQPYGAALVARGRHIGSYFAEHGGDPQQRVETLMHEYGSAGVVRGEPIVARV
jgi:2-polyprenyl-6-methoxyphenol hydroxylase-like FAD-dependent oxidoreductase